MVQIQLQLKPQVVKFINKLPSKHKRQVKDYILKLQDNPVPQDSKPLVHYKPYLRGDVGEYRVIYRFSKKDNVIMVVLVGKRNGGAVYQQMKRILQTTK